MNISSLPDDLIRYICDEFLSFKDITLLSMTRFNNEYYVKTLSTIEFNKIREINLKIRSISDKFYIAHELRYCQNNNLFISGYFIIEKLLFRELRECVKGMTIKVDDNNTYKTRDYKMFRS